MEINSVIQWLTENGYDICAIAASWSASRCCACSIRHSGALGFERRAHYRRAAWPDRQLCDRGLAGVLHGSGHRPRVRKSAHRCAPLANEQPACGANRGGLLVILRQRRRCWRTT